MPTRKQRRRREKELRHEYEVVWVDEEGRELEEPPPEAERPAKGAKGSAREQRGAKRPASARGVQPPSWRRVLKRAGLFAPFMFLMIYVLEPDTSIAQKVFFTAQLVLLFIPFSYLVDSMTYRAFRRREEKQRAAAGAAKR